MKILGVMWKGWGLTLCGHGQITILQGPGKTFAVGPL